MKHIDSADCWCFPVLVAETETGRVWAHRDEAGKMPPEEIVKQAIAVLEQEPAGEPAGE